jgi:hypothetical protein
MPGVKEFIAACSNVPWWGRPSVLLMLTGAAFVLALLTLVLLPKAEKKAEMSD